MSSSPGTVNFIVEEFKMTVQIAIRALSFSLEELEEARKLSAWDGIFMEVWQP